MTGCRAIDRDDGARPLSTRGERQTTPQRTRGHWEGDTPRMTAHRKLGVMAMDRSSDGGDSLLETPLGAWRGVDTFEEGR